MFGNILTTLLSPASFSAPGGFSIHGPALLVLPSIVLFLALAIGSLVWVWNDAQKRNKNSFIVLLFVLLTGWPASFLWWFWLRPPFKEQK